jgi:1-phosphofructokinase family hexose kinase
MPGGRGVILTLTPNPTIDRAIFCRDFRLGAVVRAERESVIPSGKGVDASLVIHELGGDTLVLGLKAGLNGRLHGDLLDQRGIAHDMVPADGETRMAIVLVDLALNEQSTISAPTLTAREDSLQQLLDRVERHADRAWGLICAGSLPPGLPEDSYAHLIRAARTSGLTTLLDTSGSPLKLGVQGVPHILKINMHELQALGAVAWPRNLGCEALEGPPTEAEALGEWLGNRLRDWASEAIVITLGREGALAVTTEGAYRVRPPQVPVVNTAGAGDALDAGMMLARSRGADWPEALILGTAAAASVVMNEGTAICRRDQVEELLSHVRVHVL